MKTSKYQQTMEQVELSPEADERISAAIRAAQQGQRAVPPGKKTAFRFGRAAVIAAVLTGLLTIAMAVSHYSSLGEVNDIIVLYETGPQHNLTVKKAFASPDAPETIQEYYLPTFYVSINNLRSFWMDYIEKDENGEYGVGYHYEPTSWDPEKRVKESPLLDTPTMAYYGWGPEPGMWITVHFMQTVATYFDDGDVLSSYAAGDSPTALTSFELDGYEIYAFALLANDGSGEELSRTWYWTDGNYLFHLICHSVISDETMTEIFRSIRPVGSVNPYLAEFE